MKNMFKSRRFKASLLVLVLAFVQYYAPSILPAELVISLQAFFTGLIGYFAITPAK